MDDVTIKWERQFKGLALFFFFLVVFFSFVYPVSDPDTPWHLLTGQYIFTNRTIPMAFDPFSFATEKIPFMGRFILSQNWVAQSLLFVIYRSLGPLGLVLTRAVVFTLTISIIWYLVDRKKGALIAIFSSGVVAFLTHTYFSGIRPQIFTFLFSAVLILLIERYRDTRSVRWLYPMPLLMLVWANMHGGFIYGVVLIFIYLFGTALELLLKGRLALPEEDLLSSRQFTLLLVLGLLSVLVSLINPNTYEAFVYTFMSQAYDSRLHSFYAAIIQEYKSPFTISRTNPSAMTYGFWVCAACAAVMTAVFIRRRRPTQLLLLIFAITPALVAIRYVPLFLIVGAPLVSYMPHIALSTPTERFRSGAWVAIALLFSFIAIYTNPFRSRTLLRFNESYHYPVKATDFLLKNGIKGNIFGSYNTGAFILFKCFPESRIYFDSMFVDTKRVAKGLMIEGVWEPPKEELADINTLIPAGIGTIDIKGGGRQRGSNITGSYEQWRQHLHSINADIIVHEAVDHISGEIFPFVFKLARDNEWKLIHADGTVMIFVRNKPKFKNIISRYELPKSRIYDEILEECAHGAGVHGDRCYSDAALSLLLKGIADDNTASFIDKALSNDPKDPIANYSKALYILMTHGKKAGS